MAITVSHPFVSTIADDSAAAAAGQVVPSNWNANHSITGTLDVANGGTGVTTSTGSGSVVLSDGPTFAPNVTISGASNGDALRITQTGAGNALVIEDEANVDNTPFVVNGSGNVILGHTAQLAGAQYNPALEVFGADPSVSGIGQFQYSANTLGPRFQLNKTRGASPSTQTIVQLDDELGTIQFSGSDGANYIRGANIRAFVDGTPGTNDMPGRLVFSTTADGASSPTERMRISNAGNVLVGRTYTGAERIGIGGGTSTISSGTGAFGILNDTIISSAQTSFYDAHSTYIGTEAATFTISNLRHYRANQQPLGASSVITNQSGFVVDGALTGGTNNFGFYSNLASATGRWNFYAAGTAANYFAGSTGIGGLPTTDAFRISGTASGSTFVNGQVIDQTIGSGVTSSYRGLLIRPIMQNAAFTLSTLYHLYVNPQTKPAAATLNNQYGFMAESTITDATSNYGFFGNLASATGRWNFYGGGTAANHFSGTVSIGVPAVTYGLEVNKTLTGGTERYQALISGEIQSDVTSVATGVYVLPSIANSAFTLATYRGFQAGSFGISGAATITTYHGFFAGATTQANITTAYGYTSNLAASGSSRWNFYAGGTAPNYFAGNSTFNTGLTVNGTTNLAGLTASTALALDASKNVVSITNTGTGNNVLATSPALTTPDLGTPSAANLANATGLPISTGISGLGADVAAALAVAVGSAGGPVVSGGALGTPSSGTVTNLSGTASININGTVGATTPASGAFTTLVTSDIAVFNGAIGDAAAGTEITIAGTAPTSGGTNAGGISLTMLAPSSVTNQYLAIRSAPGTNAAAFTAGTLACFAASSGTIGAGSEVTNLHGYLIQTGLTTGINNFGVYSNIAAATNRWNFYANGTAQNYFAGNTFIGGTTGNQALNVNGAVRVSAITTANQTSAGTVDFTGGNLRFLCWGASGTQGVMQWLTGAGNAGASVRMTLNGSNNLGLATATFGTSATNTFSVASGTAPSSGVADTVQFYSSDLSAGNTIPSFYTEGTGIVGATAPTATRSVAVRINGTVYYLLASLTA